MAYTDTGGAGTALVLLHGTYCDAEDWAATIAALPAASLRIINFEFRGHGHSDVPATQFTIDDLASDTLALLEHLQIQDAVLAGHSLGGIVAMMTAARSAWISGLVLLEGWTSRRAYEAYSGERTYGRLNAEAIARIRQKAETYRGRCPQLWAAFSNAPSTFDAYTYLQNATIPIAEVYGSLGKTPETESALEIPDNPAIEMIWIPDAGHYLPHERPVETATVCARAVSADN